MKTTLLIDSFGCLQGWQGEHLPTHFKGTIYKVNNKDCELFIQNDFEVYHALDNLTKDEQEFIKKGYILVTENFPSEYFICD